MNVVGKLNIVEKVCFLYNKLVLSGSEQYHMYLKMSVGSKVCGGVFVCEWKSFYLLEFSLAACISFHTSLR